MAIQFDVETIERLRGMPPQQAFESARFAVHLAGNVGSEDFLDAYDQLVECGILTWDQVEEFEG